MSYTAQYKYRLSFIESHSSKVTVISMVSLVLSTITGHWRGTLGNCTDGRDFWTAPYVSMGRPSSLQSMYVCPSIRPSGVTTLNCLYLTQFLTDFGQILDSKSYDQALQTL